MINTIEDAVYMGMKNDLSFLFQNVLNLYEHQSTFSPNLPLRGLFYFSDLYRKLLVHDRDIYSSRQLALPFPQFVVFYNGTKEEPEQQLLYLHDAFPKEMSGENAALDCKVVVLNINLGHNRQIMQKCRKLEEYAIFIAKIRNYTSQKLSIEKAIDKATDECIREGVLERILRENREEVCSMLLAEYDEQAHIAGEREIAKEEERERINRLTLALAEVGRLDDIVKAANDRAFQEKLLDEFGI